MTENADLLYAGRERKRPAGASDIVQQIWLLLRDNPQGLTRDEIQSELATGWLDTDAYRMYDAKLRAERKSGSRRHSVIQTYGTPEFKERAQRWYVAYCLKNMGRRTAHFDGDKWFATDQPPMAQSERFCLVPLTQIADGRLRANQSQVAREYLKAACRDAVDDKRNSKGHRALAKQVLDYLSR